MDELEEPSKVPTRTGKFAPGRAAKHKSKLKQEPVVKPEPKPESAVELKPEQFGPPILSKEENEATESGHTLPKIEPSDLNGIVKMEDGSRTEEEAEDVGDIAMEEDHVDQQPLAVEEEDKVVREIDVFFNPSKDANTKIYVLQYPLRPRWRPYELDERCEEVRLKPATSEIEVDLSIDVDSKNYDRELGSKIKMTKQTLSTSWKPSRPSNYAVGVIVGDKLHLNPLHAVVQLRPSMKHLTSASKKQHIVTPKEESLVGESAGPSKKQNKGIEPSTEQKTVTAESCVSLKFHGLQSDFSSRYLQSLMATQSHSIDFNMSLSDFISSLCPGGTIRNPEPKGPSKRMLLSLPLEERLKKLLCEGLPFHRFSALKHFAPNDSPEDILRILQQDALLVQGLWTAKTKLLNLDPALSFARDYVLVLFNKSATITSAQVDAAGRNRDRVKEILNSLAIERPLLNDWKFKEAADASFLKHYPDVFRMQEGLWRNMEDKVMALIRGGKKRGSKQ